MKQVSRQAALFGILLIVALGGWFLLNRNIYLLEHGLWDRLFLLGQIPVLFQISLFVVGCMQKLENSKNLFIMLLLWAALAAGTVIAYLLRQCQPLVYAVPAVICAILLLQWREIYKKTA